MRVKSECTSHKKERGDKEYTIYLFAEELNYFLFSTTKATEINVKKKRENTPFHARR